MLDPAAIVALRVLATQVQDLNRTLKTAQPKQAFPLRSLCERWCRDDDGVRHILEMVGHVCPPKRQGRPGRFDDPVPLYAVQLGDELVAGNAPAAAKKTA